MYIRRYKDHKQYRFKFHNYGDNGFYFITICAHNRKHYFGEIENGRMGLSEIGMIVDRFIVGIPESFNNIKIDEYVVMPNHLHAIIEIDNNPRRHLINQMPTQNNQMLTQNQIPTEFRSGIKNNPMELPYVTLGKIIRYYKGSTTHEVRKLYGKDLTIWQSRFYDHIIRNEEEYINVKSYVINNPINWKEDYFK